MQGHRPHTQAQPLPKIIRGDKTGWGSPWRGEPTRQEPALLSNHDGANPPEPARLCNDLKQRGRPTGPPHPFKHGPQVRGEKGGQQGRTWNLEPANPGWLDGPQPHLNSTHNFSTRLRIRSCPSSTPLPYAMFPIHQKPQAGYCWCCYYPKHHKPPDGTWLNAGSVMLCLTRS